MATLPDSWDPTIVEGLFYYDVISASPDGFTYSLIADHLTFDSWHDAATDEEIYEVTVAESSAAAMFSPFIISHQIFANEIGDGACIINSGDDLGAVCIILTSSSDATTYRHQ